jgi:hypothetical protein
LALRSLVQLRGILEGLPGGSVNIAPSDIQNTTPPQNTLQDVLANGDNIVPIPALADGIIIIFDPTSTTVKKIKGAGGDTGVIVSKTSWIVLTFDTTPPASIIINSSAADTGKYTTMIFF